MANWIRNSLIGLVVLAFLAFLGWLAWTVATIMVTVITVFVFVAGMAALRAFGRATDLQWLTGLIVACVMLWVALEVVAPRVVARADRAARMTSESLGRKSGEVDLNESERNDPLVLDGQRNLVDYCRRREEIDSAKLRAHQDQLLEARSRDILSEEDRNRESRVIKRLSEIAEERRECQREREKIAKLEAERGGPPSNSPLTPASELPVPGIPLSAGQWFSLLAAIFVIAVLVASTAPRLADGKRGRIGSLARTTAVLAVLAGGVLVAYLQWDKVSATTAGALTAGGLPPSALPDEKRTALMLTSTLSPPIDLPPCTEWNIYPQLGAGRWGEVVFADDPKQEMHHLPRKGVSGFAGPIHVKGEGPATLVLRNVGTACKKKTPE